MTIHTNIIADSPPLDFRDVASAAQLETIRHRGQALRLAWAMQGLCKQAEKAGVDVTYWRTLAAEIEGKIR